MALGALPISEMLSTVLYLDLLEEVDFLLLDLVSPFSSAKMLGERVLLEQLPKMLFTVSRPATPSASRPFFF